MVTVGFALGEATVEAALEYPDTMFIGVDQFQAETIPNLAGLVFHEDHAGYLAGVLAANLTESNTIAGVFGTDLIPASWPSARAMRRRSPRTPTSRSSPPTTRGDRPGLYRPGVGANTAAQAIARNADVVFAAGGQTEQRRLEETATHEGLYCIGVDTDQWETLPGAHPCLVSSAIKSVRSGVTELIRAVASGTFEGARSTATPGWRRSTISRTTCPRLKTKAPGDRAGPEGRLHLHRLQPVVENAEEVLPPRR